MTKLITQMQLDFKDVLIKPLKSHLNSRSQVKLQETYKFLHSPLTYTGVPLIIANMDTTGTMSAAKVMSSHHCMTALHKHYTESELIEFFKSSTDEAEIELLAHQRHHTQHTFYSMGVVERDVAKFKSVASVVGTGETGIRMICIDVANGYMKSFVDFCSKMRSDYPSLIIMAGNVVDGSMTQELLGAGVDIVKVGIGSGSVCQTRVVAGTGRPQFSAVLDCQEAAAQMGGHIVSDGGITCIADFSKALGAGAFGVMAGGMFSGHDESERDVVEVDGQKFVEFYGMSSEAAMERYSGGVAQYRASEGKRVLIPYKGSLHQSVSAILGGIRSAHTYVGAESLSQFRTLTQFYRVSQEVNEIYGRSK